MLPESDEDHILAGKTELTSIQENLAELQSRKAKLENFISQHLALKSPIRRIPEDILREVFEMCLPEDRLPARELAEAPLLLTTVCRSWRAVAVSTPTLWNAVQIRLPSVMRHDLADDTFEDLVARRLEGTKLWLERSGSLPLSIHFSAQLGCSCNSWTSIRAEWERANPLISESMARFIRLFVSYYPRWRRVSFNVPAPVLRYEEIPISQLFPDRLETLEIIRTFSEVHPENGLLSNLLRAPTLKALHLHEERMFDNLDLPTRFHGLTRLIVTSSTYGLIAPETAFNLLRCCSHTLTVCSLDLACHAAPTGLPPMVDGPLALLCLRRLIIRFRGRAFSATMTPLFQSFAAPQLKQIGFHVLGPQAIPARTLNTEDLLSFLSDFVRRCGCDLTLASLSLSLPVGAENAAQLLETLPALTTLKVVSDSFASSSIAAYHHGQTAGVCTVTSEFLERLTLGSNPSETFGCPHLEHVHFKDCDPQFYEPLLEFAESRTYGDRQKALHSYYVDFWRPIPDGDNVRQRLRLLREAGVDVKWRSRLRPTPRVNNDGPRDGLEGIHGEEFLFPASEDTSSSASISY
ncbi:hypothetical protein PM082_008862 [Marasmius tenuissimus]|nr:hypothetical protein PM082_008862 [Marasmius tenuissimus]